MKHHIHTIHSAQSVYGNGFPFFLFFRQRSLFDFPFQPSWLVLAYILQRYQIIIMQLKAIGADDDYRFQRDKDDVYFLLVPVNKSFYQVALTAPAEPCFIILLQQYLSVWYGFLSWTLAGSLLLHLNPLKDP